MSKGNCLFSDIMEPDYGVDQSPPDDTRITQVILYFNQDEAEELKMLAKEIMKVEYPETYITEGNLSGLYLKILRKYYNKLNHK